MKLSIKWLKDYVKVNVSIEKIIERLTMAGLEVKKSEEVQGDTVLELEITPNRPDCLSVLGVARETATLFEKPLKLPRIKKRFSPLGKCNVSVLDHEGCRRYIGTLIRDVNIADAPAGMTQRLNSVGNRPINNVVDITNFCLMETGQPLHAFDYDKLVGGKVVVRRAKKGEKIVTIDGVERELDDSIIVIADSKRPVAIAGIMGGKDTEVTQSTKNVLLESAWFNPLLIRRASRWLGLSSESSYRFERGVDIKAVETASDRAVCLIHELCKGAPAQRQDVFSSKRKITTTRISILKDQIDNLLGTKTPVSRCKTILKKLGFGVTVENKTLLSVTVPSFRGDVRRDVDLVEEIGRILGYDNLPVSLPVIQKVTLPKNPRRVFRKKIKDTLCAAGFREMITYSMTNTESLKKSGLQESSCVKVLNPLTIDQEFMRPSLLPSAMEVARFNINRGEKNLKLFEVGKIYFSDGERETLAIVATGFGREDWREIERQSMDFYDLKGILGALEKSLSLKKLIFVPEDCPGISNGCGAKVVLGNKTIGFLGKISKNVLNEWDIKQDEVYYVQMDCEILYQQASLKKAFVPVSGFPSTVRDISLAVEKSVLYENILSVIREHGKKILKDVRFVEQYLGEKIPAGQKGLVFSLTYQAQNRTLTEEEVDEIHQNICKDLVHKANATIR